MEIKITGPTTEDMFFHKKGTIVCEVTVNRPSVERIVWEDKDGNEMAGASLNPSKGKRGLIKLPLDLTYEEWSSGVVRVCVVEHSDIIDRIKEQYERKIGKFAVLFNEKLVHIITMTKGLIVLSFLQRNQCSALQFICCLQ